MVPMNTFRLKNMLLALDRLDDGADRTELATDPSAEAMALALTLHTLCDKQGMARTHGDCLRAATLALMASPEHTSQPVAKRAARPRWTWAERGLLGLCSVLFVGALWRTGYLAHVTPFSILCFAGTIALMAAWLEILVCAHQMGHPDGYER